MPRQAPISARDVLTVLFKHRAKMLLTFSATVIGVGVVVFAQPSVYESSASLLIRFGRQFIYRPEAGRDLDDVQNRSRAAVINAEMDILKSDDLLQQVIQDVGLRRLYPGLAPAADGKPPASALRRMAGAYRVRGMDESNTLRVSFEHTDRELAAAVVNAAVARFTEKHVQAFSDPRMVSFYEEKVTLYRQKLDEIDGRLRDYQQSQATVDVEEQGTLLLQQLNRIDGQVGDTRVRIAGLTHRVATLEQQLAQQSEQAPLYEESEREARGIEEQLLQLKLREKELRSQFKETDRQVVNVQTQIALVEGFLSERDRAGGTRRVRLGRNEVFDQLEIALANARAELAELKATLPPARQRRTQLAQVLAGLPARQQLLHELQREREVYESTYANYQKRLSDARVFADMDRELIADVSVIQRALPADKPIRPDRKTALAIGFLVGLCLALAVAFVSEFLGSTWDAPGRAAADLDLPVLGSVRYREGFGQ